MNYFDELPINESNLMGELQDQHMRFAKWGSEYATAAKRTREAKINLDHSEAELRDMLRGQIEGAGQRATEGLLNERLNLNDDYRSMKAKVAKLEHHEMEMKNARDAFYMRKEVILELCKFMGHEMSNTYEAMAKKLDGRRN